MKFPYEINKNYELGFESPNDEYSYFFGYYDKQPLNKEENRLLSHRVAFDGREVQDNDKADIGFFDLSSRIFIKIDETTAWNWQQGAQLQWLPEHEDTIIYNKISNGQFVSVIYEINTQKRREIPFPVYTVHPSGTKALGIRYERHYFCRRGYDYKNIVDPQWDKPVHPDDGIYLIDLISGDVKLIVRTLDAALFDKPDDYSFSLNNWLEHMHINPSGTRFSFFHRWHQNGIDHSRFFTASMDGSELYMYPNMLFYSHYDWVDDEHLIVWSRDSGGCCNSAEKPSMESHLIQFKDRDGSCEIIGKGILKGNGHTTYIASSDQLLNDTYEDKQSYRHLQMFNKSSNIMVEIGRFYSMYNSCYHRADLHPRATKNGNKIVIDSAHVANRKIMIIEKKDYFEICGIKIGDGNHISNNIKGFLENSTYESQEIQILIQTLNKEDRVLELGAGLGLLSAYCAKVIGDDNILSYEANPLMIPQIKNNYKRNGVSPKIRNAVVGCDNRERTFFLEEHFWSSSTLQRSKDAQAIKVDGVNIDDVISEFSPNFLIIDIEGGEIDIVFSMNFETVNKVIMEIHPHVIGNGGAHKILHHLYGVGFIMDFNLSRDNVYYFYKEYDHANK